MRAQAARLGLPVEIVSRGDRLLDYARRRGKWPGPTRIARWCTSEFKRAPIDKVITRVAKRQRRWAPPVRVLNVLGIRAAESPSRARRQAFERDVRKTRRCRVVDQWYPIFRLSERDVWQIIRQHELPVHPAYALGMPRLSCRLCIFAPRSALILAGRHNLALLREYTAVEREIGHSFKKDLKIADVLDAVERGDEPGEVRTWEM